MKRNAATVQIRLGHGAPILFAGGPRGLSLTDADPSSHVVDVADGARRAAGVIVHDPANAGIARMPIDRGPANDMPVAPGVIYDDPRPTFAAAVIEQNAQASVGKKPAPRALIVRDKTWQAEKEPHIL